MGQDSQPLLGSSVTTRVMGATELWAAAAHVLSRSRVGAPTSDKRASPSSVAPCNIM
jgi:hypothetical protein